MLGVCITFFVGLYNYKFFREKSNRGIEKLYEIVENNIFIDHRNKRWEKHCHKGCKESLK